jgi:hypothetical protein
MEEDCDSNISEQGKEDDLDLSRFSPEVLDFMLGVLRAQKQEDKDSNDQ